MGDASQIQAYGSATIRGLMGARNRELERVGLGLLPKYTQYLLKIGKDNAEQMRLDRRAHRVRGKRVGRPGRLHGHLSGQPQVGQAGEVEDGMQARAHLARRKRQTLRAR